MIKEIGISARGAQRLMSIGSNSALSNATSSSHLPKALDAIYELSRLDPSDIEAGIESGAITPDMKMVPTCPRVKTFPVDRGGGRNVSTRQDASTTP